MVHRAGKPFFVIILLSVVLISGCVGEQPIGGQTDEHGCLPAAGYTWCEARQKCLRTWEEACEIFEDVECGSYCIGEGYDSGFCLWPSEIESGDVEKAGCLIPQSRHCGNDGQCNCYCRNETVIGGETDEHGCMLMAGYTWCESKRKCLRTWEEDCPAEILTPEECEAREGRVLNIVAGDECYDNETTIAGVSGFISPNVCCQSKEKACTDSGGTVSTTLCCLSIDDFPNTCNIGACGCAPASSHDVKTCDCGEGECFDGDECIINVNGFHTTGAPVIG